MILCVEAGATRDWLGFNTEEVVGGNMEQEVRRWYDGQESEEVRWGGGREPRWNCVQGRQVKDVQTEVRR